MRMPLLFRLYTFIRCVDEPIDVKIVSKLTVSVENSRRAPELTVNDSSFVQATMPNTDISIMIKREVIFIYNYKIEILKKKCFTLIRAYSPDSINGKHFCLL